MKKNFRLSLTILMSIFIISGGCRVYYKNPVQIDEAMDTKGWKKVTNYVGGEHHFKQIAISDSTLLGKKYKNSKEEEIPLSKIDKIQVEDRKKSVTGTAVILPLGTVVLLTLYILIILGIN